MKAEFRTILFPLGGLLALVASVAAAHTDIASQAAQELINSGGDLIVVDVREPTEYCDERGHIPGAVNYPWTSEVLQTRYGELPKQVPILVVCRSGHRSNEAAGFLDAHGFAAVYDMTGGMKAWTGQTAPCLGSAWYGGGTGAPDHPFLVYTTEHLDAIAVEPNDWNAHFRLLADIDLAGHVYGRALIAPDTSNTEARFQGPVFSGAFDGNGHVISHLTVKGQSFLGLFGQLSSGAAVLNLGLKAVDIIGTGSCIGGLAGCNDGTISDTYCLGKISGNDRVGGLVGCNHLGRIADSYSAAVVKAEKNVGGLVGVNTGIVVASFWEVEVSGFSRDSSGIGLTTTEMQTAATFLEAGWDFVGEAANGTEDIWQIDEAEDYPRFHREREE